MARARKPCEFCEDEWQQEFQVGNASVQVSVYPFNNFIGLWLQSQTDDGEMNGEDDDITIPMNYCPNCGRKLT